MYCFSSKVETIILEKQEKRAFLSFFAWKKAFSCDVLAKIAIFVPCNKKIE